MTRIIATGLLLAAALPAVAQSRAPLIGIVISKETSQPLAYADVFVEESKTGVFTGDRGQFHIVGLPNGPLHVRVRRLGYTPVTVTVNAGATDTVRVSLTALSLRLDRVRVSESVCSNKVASDTAVVAILQQLQLNAERSRFFAQQYPFEWTVERIFADDVRDGPDLERVRRRKVTQTDTLTLPSEHEWKYSPGNLIVSQKMFVPQIVDFAEPAFVAAHCFKYAGLAAVDGQRMIRVDLEPARGIRDDVEGSIYLDTATYQIRRTTLYAEQRSPNKATDIWEHRIDTWFSEVAPSLPVIDRIEQRTLLRDGTNGRLITSQAAVEIQRRLNLVFLGRQPD
jgi:hypothetical protein